MKKTSEREKARRESALLGLKAIEAIAANDAERAGALAMFAYRWAKRSNGSKR